MIALTTFKYRCTASNRWQVRCLYWWHDCVEQVHSEKRWLVKTKNQTVCSQLIIDLRNLTLIKRSNKRVQYDCYSSIIAEYWWTRGHRMNKHVLFACWTVRELVFRDVVCPRVDRLSICIRPVNLLKGPFRWNSVVYGCYLSVAIPLSAHLLYAQCSNEHKFACSV